MTAGHRKLPHLFENWEHIVQRIRANTRLVIFLDFDGTLVRIAPMPSGVRIEPKTQEILRKLARRRNVTLVLISGRQRVDLQRTVGIPNLKYMGLYGWENRGNRKAPFAVRLALVRILVKLLAELPTFPGVWIEPKGNSFSVHLKGASGETQRRVRRKIVKSAEPQRELVQVMTNLRDVEVAPASIGDKGSAVKRVLEEPAMRDALPFYFGDDFSDEPGFAAARKGISILVGKRRQTQAKFSLRGPAEVAEALSRMEEMIP